MDFEKIFENQKAIIEEYSLGNKPIRAILNQVLKASRDFRIPFEEMDIKVIQDVCNKQKTRRGFATTKTIIGGFYSYLGHKDTASQISEFEYINRINYFISIRHLYDTLNEEIARLEREKIIIDKNRLGNLRMYIYLVALGLSVEEISELKKSDYDSKAATLKVKDKIINIPDFINHDMQNFNACEGYYCLNRNSPLWVKFIDTDNFIKETRNGTAISKQRIYRIVNRDISFVDIDMTDVHKSKEIWDLLKEKGIDLNNSDIMKFIDLDKIKQTICNANIDKSEISAFVEVLRIYYNK